MERSDWMARLGGGGEEHQADSRVVFPAFDNELRNTFNGGLTFLSLFPRLLIEPFSRRRGLGELSEPHNAAPAGGLKRL